MTWAQIVWSVTYEGACECARQTITLTLANGESPMSMPVAINEACFLCGAPVAYELTNTSKHTESAPVDDEPINN